MNKLAIAGILGLSAAAGVAIDVGPEYLKLSQKAELILETQDDLLSQSRVLIDIAGCLILPESESPIPAQPDEPLDDSIFDFRLVKGAQEISDSSILKFDFVEDCGPKKEDLITEEPVDLEEKIDQAIGELLTESVVVLGHDQAENVLFEYNPVDTNDIALDLLYQSEVNSSAFELFLSKWKVTKQQLDDYNANKRSEVDYGIYAGLGGVILLLCAYIKHINPDAALKRKIVNQLIKDIEQDHLA